MFGQDILCGISKVPFEISQLTSCPYIEKAVFETGVSIYELSDLIAGKHF